MSNLRSVINLARERYVNPEIDTPPTLRELSAEYDVELKMLDEVCFKENWDAIRNRRCAQYKAELARVEKAEIEKVAGDVGAVRAAMFNECYGILQKHIPAVFDELLLRIPDMKDVALIAHSKTLIQLSVAMQKMIDETKKQVDQESSQNNKSIDKVISDAMRSRLVEIIDNPEAVDIDFTGIEEEMRDQDEAFSNLDQ